MDPNAISAVGLGDAAGGVSLWGLILQADIVVKTVMGLLLVASCGAGRWSSTRASGSCG
jgi:hypothetical protein